MITGCEGEVLPSAEICDGVDNDCDGLSDDDDLSLDTSTYNIYYLDSDGDGYGTLVTKESACTPSESYVANALDCDDEDATVYSPRQSFAMGRLITVLLELFLPMKVMTMVMASSSVPSTPAVGTVHWRKQVVTATMEMRPSSLGKFGIKTVIRTATVISQSSRHRAFSRLAM